MICHVVCILWEREGAMFQMVKYVKRPVYLESHFGLGWRKYMHIHAKGICRVLFQNDNAA